MQIISTEDHKKTFLNLLTNSNKYVLHAVGKYIQDCNVT